MSDRSTVMSGVVDRVRLHPIAYFWVISYAVAWGSLALPSPVDHVAKFAFTIATVAVTAATGTLRRFIAGLWRPAPPVWCAIAVAAPLAAYALSALLAPGTNRLADVDVVDVARIVLVGGNSGLLVYFFTRGGLGEEPGLRGFALEEHERSRSRLAAALTVGVLWAVWHLPVLVSDGASSAIVSMIVVVALSCLFSWTYHRSGGSVVVTAALHASINAGDDIMEQLLDGLGRLDWETPVALAMLVGGIAAAVPFAGTTDRPSPGHPAGGPAADTRPCAEPAVASPLGRVSLTLGT